MKKLFTILLSILLFNAVLHAQGVFTSKATGNWNSTGTWTLNSGSDADGIPDADDNVTMAATYTVTLAQNEAVNSISFAATSSILAMGSYNLSINGDLSFTTTPTGNQMTGTGILKFVGAGNSQSITNNSASNTPANIEINKTSGTVSTGGNNLKATSALNVVSGTLDLVAGYVAINAGTVTVSAGATLTNVGRISQGTGNTTAITSVTANGTINATNICATTINVNSGGYLKFTSSTLGSNVTTRNYNTGSTIEYGGSGTTATDMNYYNLVISYTTTWTAASSRTVSNDLTIAGGANGRLTWSGLIQVNGNMTVSSTNTTVAVYPTSTSARITGTSGKSLTLQSGAWLRCNVTGTTPISTQYPSWGTFDAQTGSIIEYYQTTAGTISYSVQDSYNGSPITYYSLRLSHVASTSSTLTVTINNPTVSSAGSVYFTESGAAGAYTFLQDIYFSNTSLLTLPTLTVGTGTGAATQNHTVNFGSQPVTFTGSVSITNANSGVTAEATIINLNAGAVNMNSALTLGSTTYTTPYNCPYIVFNNAASQLTIGGTATFRSVEQTNGNVKFTNSGQTLTFNGNVTTSGTSGTAEIFNFNGVAPTVNFNGNLSDGASGTTFSCTGTEVPVINFGGTSKTISACVLRGAVTFGGTRTASGNVSVGANSGVTYTAAISGTLDMVSYTLNGNNASATRTLSGSGTMKLTGSLATQVTGWTTNSFVSSGTTEFNGSAQQTIPTGTYGGITVNNSAGALAGGAISTGNLTMTTGVFDMSGNLLSVTNTTAGAVTGGSTSSYVKGAMSRVLPASLVSGSTYTLPIGKTNYNAFDLVNPTTTSGGTVTVQAEAFDADCGGTAGTGLTSIDNTIYWQTSITAGAANFTDSKVRLTKTGVTTQSGVGYSATLAGAYNSQNGTLSGSSVTSRVATTSLDYFVLGSRELGRIYAGTYTVGSGSWPTIQSVIDTLNDEIVSGNLIFELSSDYTGTETAPLSFPGFNDEGNNYTITIRPASGVTGKSVTTTSSSPLLDLNGAKRYTFDGRPGGSGTSIQLSFSNDGGPVVSFTNDASNNTVTYLNLTSLNSASSATGVVNFGAGVTTGNDNNTVSYCNINGSGSYCKGIYSAGSSQTIDNGSNSITNNNIYDWYTSSASTSNAGVYLGSYNNAWTITGNSIYETTTRSPSNNNSYYGVYISSSTGNGFAINNNYIGGNGPNGGSGNLTINGSAENKFLGIALNAVGNTTATEVQGNTISKIYLQTTPAATSAAVMWLMSISAGSANFGTTADNIIGSASATGAITVDYPAGAYTSYVDGFRIGATGASDVVTLGSSSYKNIFGGISVTGSTTTATNITMVRFGGTSTAATYNFNNNRIGEGVTNSIQAASGIYAVMTGFMTTTAGNTASLTNNVVANMTNNSTHASSTLRGLDLYYGNNTVTGNSIYNLTYAGPNIGTGTGGCLHGILINSPGTTQTLSNNSIYSLYSTYASAAAVSTYGIYSNFASGGTYAITKNKIYDLTISNSNSDNTATIRGILIYGYTTDVSNNMISLGSGQTNSPVILGLDKTNTTTNSTYYYNSVYITGTPASGSGSTYCWRRTTTPASDDLVKNNILINDRANSGATGVHYVIRTSNSSSPIYLTTDYNDLYANTSAGGLYVQLNTTNYTSFANWKAAAAAQDQHSVSALAPFVSTTNLAIDNTNASCWAINGMGTYLAGFSDDYAATSVRSTTVAGGPTDLGCDEFNTSTTPADAVESGSIADGSTTTYTLNGKTMGTLAWHDNGGTLTAPTMSFRYYPGITATGGGETKSKGYWLITAAGGNNYAYDITINYDPVMIGNISSESNIRLAKSADNNNWTQFADAGTAPNQYALNTTNKTITVYGLTSFSYFTLGDNSGPLPVELTAFTASANGRNMILNWQTATEINSSKFVVERSSNKSTWSAIGEVAASGNSNSVKKYQFTDKARLNSGVYYYRLKMVDNDAKADYSPVVEAEIIVPSEFGLAQNYPNPFNPTTRIEYQLPQDATIAIELYSILGSKIADLFSGHQDAGYHSVDVNASKLNLQSGVYIYRLQVIGGEKNGLNLIKKMILTK